MTVTNAATADLASIAANLAYASGDAMARAASKVLQDAAQQVQQQAQANAPVKSGRLRDSISIKNVDALKTIVGPNVEYGVYQEYGTGSRGEFPGQAYMIRPKRAGGLLAFKIGNKTVYSRSVRHPGIKAHPFMRPAIEAVLGTLAGDMAERGALLITKGPNA